MNDRYKLNSKAKGQPKLPIITGIVVLLSFTALYFLDEKPEEQTIQKLGLPLKADQQELVEQNSKTIPAQISIMGTEPVEIQGLSEGQLDLPELGNSDNALRSAMINVSPDLLTWMQFRHLIKSYIVFINDLSQKQLNYKNYKFLTLTQKFSVGQDAMGLYIASASYVRYESIVRAIDAIKTEQAMVVYQRFKPLFQLVFEDFAYPKTIHLEDIFVKAAAGMVAAPVIEGRIGLKVKGAIYQFEDEKLESLPAVEKLMIRMGPENARILQAKLRELLQAVSGLRES